MTEGAGKALTFSFSGLALPEAAQDKRSRRKAKAANLMGSTGPWHPTGTSGLLCKPHASHREEGFIRCCFLLLFGKRCLGKREFELYQGHVVERSEVNSERDHTAKEEGRRTL